MMEVGESHLYEPRYWFVFGLLFVMPPLLYSTKNARRPRVGLSTIISLTIFFSYTILTIMWSYDYSVAMPKAMELTVLLIFLIMLHIILSRWNTEKFLFSFWTLLMFALVVFAVMVIFSLSVLDTYKVSLLILGGGANSLGRYMGLLCLGSIYFWEKKGKAPVWIVFSALAVLLVLASGSRGALIAFMGSILIYLVVERNPRTIILAAFVCIIFLIFWNYSIIGEQAEKSFERRVVTSVFENRDDSHRLELFDSAIGIWERHPVFGAGLNSFSSITTDAYPHNMFLEALSEGGIVGVFLLITVFAIFFVKLMRLSHFDKVTLASMVLLLIGAQISGDLYYHRGVFIFLMIVIYNAEYRVGKRFKIVLQRNQPPNFSQKRV